MKTSTMNFTGNREAVVRFANDLVLYSARDFQSITIIPQGRSEVFSVSTVIDTSSVDIVKSLAQSYFLQHTSTSTENTQDG